MHNISLSEAAARKLYFMRELAGTAVICIQPEPCLHELAVAQIVIGGHIGADMADCFLRDRSNKEWIEAGFDRNNVQYWLCGIYGEVVDKAGRSWCGARTQRYKACAATCAGILPRWARVINV